jgi:MoaA/NifB/PqqE/SkfB family radical SAM enzyme
MIKVRCSYEQQDDGSYLLSPQISRHFPNPKPFVLAAPQVQLWETIVRIASLSRESQDSLFQQLNRDIAARVLGVISTLGQAGCLEVDAGFELDAIEPPKSPRLNKLHLEITHNCNFACRACYLGAQLLPMTARNSCDGTTEQWIKLVKEAGILGCSYATVTGGDPFTRLDVLEILDTLSENGIAAEINTNASLINPKIARALRSLMISAVAVTIYGFDRESSASYTGNPVGYQAALRGIRCLVEEDVPTIVKYFATKNNVEGYNLVREEMERLGVQVRCMGHGIHGDLFEGSVASRNLVSQTLSKPQVIQENALPCYPSVNGLGIEPDGTVRACPKLTIYFGNAFEEGLERIWQKSADLSAFREFWIHYCKQAGYVRGTREGSLCPASDILSQTNSLNVFKDLWSEWREHR